MVMPAIDPDYVFKCNCCMLFEDELNVSMTWLALRYVMLCFEKPMLPPGILLRSSSLVIFNVIFGYLSSLSTGSIGELVSCINVSVGDPISV